MNWPYRNTLLSLTTLAFAATMVARLVISPLVPDVTAAFGVSRGTLGLALSGMWAAYALSQYPGGLLADRYGERKLLLVAAGSVGIASLLLAASPLFATFALFAVALGAAAGLPYSAATSLLTKAFDETGRAIGIYAAGGPAAGLLAPVAATTVAAVLGWRSAIGLGALVAVPTAVGIALLVRPTQPDRPDAALTERVHPSVVRDVLTRPSIAFTILVAIGGAFTWQAVASFLPTFLVQYWGYSQGTAGLVFSAYFVANGATQPVTGWLSDHVGRDAAAAVTMGTAAVGFVVLLAAPTRRLALAAIPLVGLGMSWGAPVQTRFMDLLGEGEQAMGFGLVRTVYMTVGALGSVVVGALSDAIGWTVAFGLLAVLMGLAVAALLGWNRFTVGA
ncbi:MAG: MFS transporter [Haloarculaceae archaeon]